MRKIQAYVWWCQDDWCNCSQARIELLTPIPGKLFYDRTILWEGKFFTDGEGYLPGGSSNELNRLARKMRKHWHDVYINIEWPWTKP